MSDGTGESTEQLGSGQTPAGPSDAELITASRAGDTGAFETLYRRHSEAARRYAMSLTGNPADRDDLVSEAFAKVLSTLRNGGGPDLAFRSYLLSAVRNTFYDRTRRDRRLEVTDDMERHDRGVAFTDTVVEGLERTLAARAFATLPERWQMVLWHTEVEGDSPADVAPLLGLTPNGVAALAYRARERLRQAYLSVHVADVPQTTVVAGTTCGWTAERLGARVRGGLSKREASKVDAHLHDCAKCKVLYAELGELNSGLRGVIGPLILGTAIGGYFLKPAAVLAVASGGLAGLWHWVLLVAGRIKDFFKQPSGMAAGAGAVVVVIAVVAGAFVLNSGHQQPKPPSAAAPNNPAAPPGGGGGGAPAAPPPAAPGAPGAPNAPAGQPGQPATAGPSQPASASPVPTVKPTLGVSSVGPLAAGRPGVIKAVVSSPANGSRGNAVRIEPVFGPLAAPASPLTLKLGNVLTITNSDGADGWSCKVGAHTCTHAALSRGATTIAYVRVTVASNATGTIPISVSGGGVGVSSASSTLPVPVRQEWGTVYATTGRTSLQVAGNTLMSCVALDFGCLAARKRLPNPSGIDNQRRMVPYDTDHDATTKASSSARLSGSGRVLYAGLFWSASAKPGGRVPTAQLTGPGGRKITLNPDLVDGPSGSSAFQAYTDVTNTVRAGGFGTWTVGWRTPPTTSLGGYAGWGLIVVTSNPSAANGQVAVFDANIGIGSGGRRSATIDLPLDMSGSSSRVAVVGWEGDAGLTGDRLSINAHALSPVDRRCSPNDAFCSHADGAAEAPGNAFWNTFGTDAWIASGGRLSRTSDLVGQSSTDAVTLGAFAVSNQN